MGTSTPTICMPCERRPTPPHCLTRDVPSKHLVQDPRWSATAGIFACGTRSARPRKFHTRLIQGHAEHVAQRPRRRPPRRHHVSLRPAVPAGPYQLHRGDLDGNHLAGSRDLPVTVRRADVCHRRRIPSLFLASGVCDRAGLPVHPGLPRPEQRAEERFVVGGQASTPSPAFRHRNRRAFAASPRLSVQPCRLDLSPAARCDRSGESRRSRAIRS